VKCENAETEMPQIPQNDLGNGEQIHMDAMAFGMGCCCLQCTFQVCICDDLVLFSILILIFFVPFHYSQCINIFLLFSNTTKYS
jgi:hypothetical protein